MRIFGGRGRQGQPPNSSPLVNSFYSCLGCFSGAEFFFNPDVPIPVVLGCYLVRRRRRRQAATAAALARKRPYASNVGARGKAQAADDPEMSMKNE